MLPIIHLVVVPSSNCLVYLITSKNPQNNHGKNGNGKRKAAVNQIIESKLEDYPGERDEYAPLFLPRELRPPRRQRFGFLQRREDSASGVRG